MPAQSPQPAPRPLQQQDLALLVCPACHQSLTLEAASVRCTGCTRHYPIVDNIPVLLAGRATTQP